MVFFFFYCLYCYENKNKNVSCLIFLPHHFLPKHLIHEPKNQVVMV